MARIAWIVVMLGLLATGAARASDEGHAPWLQWRSPPGSDACLDPDLFARRVERSLGRSPAAAANGAHVTVAARIERVGGAASGPPLGWRGEIRVRGSDGVAHGVRSLSREGASCEPLADALALATAVVLWGDGVEPPPPGSPGTTGEGEADRASGLTSDVAPRPAGDPAPREPSRDAAAPRAIPVENARLEALPSAGSPRSWQMGIDAALAFGIGLLPEASLGTRASLFLRLAGGTKIFAAGSVWAGQTSAAGTGRGATMSIASLGAGVCPLNVGRGAWTWLTCARGDVGRLHAVGFGFATAFSAKRLTADAAVAVEAQRRVIGPLYAGVAAELVVPLIRDRVAYSGPSGEVMPIFRPAPVAGVGTLRLGCAF